MTEIATWLRGLGLEAYARRFIDSGIDLAGLPNLTNDDLKELGLLLGHRRRVLAAIANLPRAPHAAKSRALSASAVKDAERRQLTVMFCDMVGSTALSTRLDPEDMSRLIQDYQNTCTRVIARYEGVIAQFMGDGVLAYFGYPLAHEDDAERAARAGLEITDAVAKLTSTANEPLQARVGIATGVVVVGDLIGEGVSQELPAIGGTPNLASRLQGLAEPGSVVIAKSTRILLGEAFKLRDLGNHTV